MDLSALNKVLHFSKRVIIRALAPNVKVTHGFLRFFNKFAVQN